jgi:TonB-linked SusC/RagA family outer membrane protein
MDTTISKVAVLMMSFLLMAITASAQQHTIKGTVTDAQTGNSLPGVNILVVGTSTGAATNTKGHYSLSVSSLQDTLRFSFIGYKTKTVPIKGRLKIKITLNPSIISGNQLVVIGYGKSKRKNLTGSISSVGSKEIEQVPVSSVTGTLEGRAPGVRVGEKSGQPGQSLYIRIRGIHSLSGGNIPLYVIDGIPVNNSASNLNPADIKSIQILKDAAATAIYGSRGANGVILITTKNGHAGKTKISYNGYFGFQKLANKMNLLNKFQYIKMANEAAANAGKPPIYTSSEIANLPNNDWQDLTYRVAPIQNHDVSISGGNKTTTFYTSLNYYNEKGIIKNSGFSKINFRINLTRDISDKINVKAKLAINKNRQLLSNGASADGGGIPFEAVAMPPIAPVKDKKGNYTVFKGVPWGATNPVGVENGRTDKNEIVGISSNIEFNYNILKNLAFKTRFGVNHNNNSGSLFIKSGLIGFGTPDGHATRSESNNTEFVNNSTLTYSNLFGKNSIKILGGFSFQQNNSKSLSATASDFLTNSLGANSLQSGQKHSAPPNSGYSKRKLISYFGRINYGYNNIYLLTLTARYDGSSVFGSQNKYAFFPASSFGWRISNEPFFSKIKTVSNLKLRISYGLAGNQAISPYQTLPHISPTQVILGNGKKTGFVVSSLGNSSLTWETTTELDIGIDLGFLSNRIKLTADRYYSKTKNLLFQASVAPSTGFSSAFFNIGKTENKGFEFGLTTENLRTALNWTSTLNMSFNRNKVLDLGKKVSGKPITEVNYPGAGGNWFPLLRGKSFRPLYGFVVDGIYQSKQATINNGEPNKTAGDYKYKDLNGDGIINNEDKKVLTHLYPKFTYGFVNHFSYKNFKLSIFIQGSYGNDIVNEWGKYYKALGASWNVQKKYFKERWTGSGSNGVIAKPELSPKLRTSSPNSMWVDNGSYLRFRNIKLAYNFPNRILSKVGINNLQIYISGKNLITITSYPGYSPSVEWAATNVYGWDREGYPSTKSVIFGLKISL